MDNTQGGRPSKGRFLCFNTSCHPMIRKIYDEVVEVLVLSTLGPDIISLLLCLAYFFIHFMLF